MNEGYYSDSLRADQPSLINCLGYVLGRELYLFTISIQARGLYHSFNSYFLSYPKFLFSDKS